MTDPTDYKVPTDREERLERWGDGPWIDEPDRVEWYASNGLPCLIVRNPMGNLCGYAAVPPSHPFYGTHYDEARLEAHGGLTWSGACNGHICHVAKPGEPDHVWWFGFDCAHCFDVVPSMQRNMPRALIESDPDDPYTMHYRDVDYVRAESEALAAQLARVYGWVEYRTRLEGACTPRQRRKAAIFAGLTRARVQRREPRYRTLNRRRRWERSVARQMQLDQWRSEREQRSRQISPAERERLIAQFEALKAKSFALIEQVP
jgi:hypothetical protein